MDPPLRDSGDIEESINHFCSYGKESGPFGQDYPVGDAL